MTKVVSIDRTLTREQEADLRAAEQIAEPDVVDIPEAPAANWQLARRIYRPRKEAIQPADRCRRSGLATPEATITIQSEINRILAREDGGGTDRRRLERYASISATAAVQENRPPPIPSSWSADRNTR